MAFWKRAVSALTPHRATHEAASATATVADPVAVRRERLRATVGGLRTAMLESTHVPGMATDERGVIQIFNPGAERLFGYASVEVVDRLTPADLCDPAEVAQRARALSKELGTTIGPGFGSLVFKASRGIADVHQQTCIRKDGSRFRGEVEVSALHGVQSKIIGYLLLVSDESVKHRGDDHLGALVTALQHNNSALERARAAAEQANLAKSAFLASMSNELRAPLNSILGFAQLLASDKPPATPAQQANISQVLNAGWYLLDLVNEILDLAAIESGQLALVHEPVPLAATLREAVAAIAPQAEKRGIQLVVPEPGPDYVVRGDRVRIRQVLVNLLSNAIAYNQPGGMVTVECSGLGGPRLRTCVRDTGAGLAPDAQRRLFAAPDRTGAQRSAEHGAGVGLVMSKRLIGLMGGTIGVESAIGVGSMFWFELDGVEASTLGSGSLDASTTAFDAPITAVEPSDVRRTVLYVEDDPANRALVERLIERRPELRLLTAANGALGIAMARAALPDVILMDVNLPGIDGVQALALLRRDPLTAGIPVLAVSANALAADVERGIAAGFDHYITKPIEIAGFTAALDEALARSPPRVVA